MHFLPLLFWRRVLRLGMVDQLGRTCLPLEMEVWSGQLFQPRESRTTRTCRAAHCRGLEKKAMTIRLGIEGWHPTKGRGLNMIH
jgi:hypothetical protein